MCTRHLPGTADCGSMLKLIKNDHSPSPPPLPTCTHHHFVWHPMFLESIVPSARSPVKHEPPYVSMRGRSRGLVLSSNSTETQGRDCLLLGPLKTHQVPTREGVVFISQPLCAHWTCGFFYSHAVSQLLLLLFWFCKYVNLVSQL